MAKFLADRKRRFVLFSLLPIILLFVLIFIYPIFSALYISLTNMELLSKTREFVGLRNYLMVLRDPVLHTAFWNTAYFVLIYLLLTLTLGLGLALFIDALDLGIKQLSAPAKLVLFLPVIMITVAACLIWKWMYNPSYGVINYILSFLGLGPYKFLASPSIVMPSVVVMTIWKWLGVNVIIFLAGIQSIPEELYQAARIDGGGGLFTFRKITLPLLVPTLEYVTVTTVLQAMQVFTEIFMLTYGGPGTASRVVALHIYEVAFRFLRISEASSVAFILFLMILLLTVFQLRLFRKETYY
jgi:multiple sugar transport system permease protein